ncbi:aldo/keto reductase [Planomonospora sp. ID67723]|uniref:aldo/keto reductase n=1 Tax=Planomonospora sp. ID67723 TaxID=2738134 RepID=UPI0018C4372B|nr:aldo/keto reductase [Planomonospora sp. ID67723]
MQTVTLNNGVEMPILGFGVYQIPPEQTEQAVTDALAAGYRLLDTAAAYMNEQAVGRAIKASGVPREELFVTTKLWISDAGEENARRAFEASLRKLGLDYLDLYLIHQPYGDVYGSRRAMESLHREGRIKAIGVSNFYPDRLVDLIDHNEITPAVNQIETHPFFQRTADQQLMRERGMQLQSWEPFAEGREGLFSHPVLSEIGAAHGKSVAQVVLRWLIRRDVVVIPKSVRPERVAENLDVFDFALTDEQMARIAALDHTGPGDERLVFDQGDTGNGGIGRDQVAEVLIRSLLTGAAIGRTFELFAEPGAVPADWSGLFTALTPDTAGVLDAPPTRTRCRP